MNFSKNLLLIAFGGAIGSVFRYLLQYWFGNVLGYSLPWGTLTANLLGSFLIGVVYAISDRFPLFDPQWKFLLASGFCGGFTTFSTFSYETFQMLKSGHYILFLGYICLSVVGGIGFAFAGVWMIKNF
ncbi:putative fluoride ion transporter CrcB [Leptospira interrogans serovar Manilae]|uniref:Fluoride-specific ion channel FluC n=1 Tax=Leptospira interrogans serovar Manilae TaxID=214675 RepID=A0AAQ1P077_LEPIR|nr:fluoride efflux transporter CrcB [Leptospira interrogans]AKP27174.1 chromosome condensation protein CrcB [Leptospira interrogans serovar Manilae]AKP30946.1 chromosome condensation protein CrcB [Leptospira interrogans serovar Manilae]EYU64143.1 chromosome condensation protein CrcB [Leptospira interrogans serovar Manilae]SOR61458.1 putative fluoride ion transporter CrcB [Leptospira interrogans serovar Manilae]